MTSTYSGFMATSFTHIKRQPSEITAVPKRCFQEPQFTVYGLLKNVQRPWIVKIECKHFSRISQTSI